MAATVPYRSVGRYPSLVMQGPQTATVVGPAGEEIHVDEHGRVKVQFHWDRDGIADENSSAWIRVAQASAGKGWGSLTIPRIGHEVLVAFVDGDPRRPVIVGSLYNGQNQPPANLPGNKTWTVLKTHSTPGGGGFNQLRFDDAAGAEEVFLRAEKDFNLEIGNDSRQDVANHSALSVGGDLTDSVDGDRIVDTGRDVTHTVGKALHLSAGDEIKLSVGNATLVLKANGDVQVNGTNIG
jgi:type VI secretion system secreted protein VgrG